MFYPTLSLLLLASSTLLPTSHASPLPAPVPVPNTLSPRQSFTDFILKDIQLTPSGSSSKTISFQFTDTNSKTSTLCTSTYPSASPPTGYIDCAPSSSSRESFRWHIVDYESDSKFGIQLRHSYSDPVKYPPPWDVVTLYATAEVKLGCSAGKCALPRGVKSVGAYVNGAVLK